MLASRLKRFLQTLGLFLVVSLALAMASLAGFAWLADEAMEAEFRGFDRSVLTWVGHHVQPAWTPYVLGLTFLGTPLGILLLTLGFGLVLVARRKVWDAATLVAIMLGAGALTVGLKALFREPRPQVFPALSPEASYSFPSGHALLSFCYFGFAAYWIVAQAPRVWWRWVGSALLLSVALLIAISRLYLGVHYPTDLAAGTLAALFWVSCCLSLRHWIARARLANGSDRPDEG